MPSALSLLLCWTTNRKSFSGYTMRYVRLSWCKTETLKLHVLSSLQLHWKSVHTALLSLLPVLIFSVPACGEGSVLCPVCPGVRDGDRGGSGHSDEQRRVLCHTLHQVNHFLQGADRLVVQRRQDGWCCSCSVTVFVIIISVFPSPRLFQSQLEITGSPGCGIFSSFPQTGS